MSSGFFLIMGILVLAPVGFMLLTKYRDFKHYGHSGIPEGMEEQYQMAIAPGSDGKPLMYNLTTCRHCVRVHDFLNKHGIAHHDVTVDHFGGEARTKVVATLRAYNPNASFPTLVFPDGKVIIGYKENALCEAFGLNVEEKD